MKIDFRLRVHSLRFIIISGSALPAPRLGLPLGLPGAAGGAILSRPAGVELHAVSEATTTGYWGFSSMLELERGEVARRTWPSQQQHGMFGLRKNLGNSGETRPPTPRCHAPPRPAALRQPTRRQRSGLPWPW